MPHYFFHMATKDQQVSDKVGRTFSNLSDAHTHALALINRSCKHLEAKDTEGWMIKVSNSTGRVLLAVLYPHRSAA